MAPDPQDTDNQSTQTPDDTGTPRAPSFILPGPPDGIPARDAEQQPRPADEPEETDSQPRPGPPDGRPG